MLLSPNPLERITQLTPEEAGILVGKINTLLDAGRGILNPDEIKRITSARDQVASKYGASNDFFHAYLKEIHSKQFSGYQPKNQ